MSDRPTPETDAQGFGDGRHPWVATDFARRLERERDEAREELQQWKMLHAWGGTPEHIDQFIRGQQSRIHEAQEIELVCEQLERERDEALSLITKTKAILQQVDLPDEPLDVQAQRMVAQHDWQLGIARGQAKQIERANRTVLAMREAIEDVNKILLAIQLNDIFEDTMRNHANAALAKLQPFISP